MSFGFKSDSTKEKPEYIPKKTFIECTECEQVFISREYNKSNAEAFCKCENLHLGIRIIQNSRFENFVTVRWNISPPKIYEEK
jgi:hypothetical protein